MFVKLIYLNPTHHLLPNTELWDAKSNMLNKILKNFPGLEKKCCRIIEGENEQALGNNAVQSLRHQCSRDPVGKSIQTFRERNLLHSNKTSADDDKELHCLEGLRRWCSGSKHLLLTPITWVRSPGSPGWKQNQLPQVVLSNLHRSAMTPVGTYAHFCVHTHTK